MHLWSLGLPVIAQLLSNVAVSGATAFGCSDSLITDEWRQMVLEFHNTHRRTVAQGQQASKDGNMMPKGSDINELNWDCNIESNAFYHNCNGTDIPPDFSVISQTIDLSGDNCKISERTTNTLNALWNEVKNENLNVPNYSDTIKNFGIMANGPTTGFACTYSKCSGKLVCLYNQAPVKSQALYTVGNTCVDAACPQRSTCENFLCKLDAGYTPSTVTLPKPMCSQGRDDGMTYEMQMTAVNMANYYRRLLGTGWAKDKGGYAPTAKTLYALGYECNTLGSGAKAKIDNCQAPPYTADQSRTLTYYKVDDVNIDPKTVIEQAFKTWADQAKKVDIQAIAESVFYEGDVATEASDWAKLTTAKNSFLGCSLKKCDAQGFTVFVCQYNGETKVPQIQRESREALRANQSQGLFTNGDPIYTVGKPCAGCAKAGRKCDNALGGGLCIK